MRLFYALALPTRIQCLLSLYPSLNAPANRRYHSLSTYRYGCSNAIILPRANKLSAVWSLYPSYCRYRCRCPAAAAHIRPLFPAPPTASSRVPAT
ncbi:Uncharacterized protein HZ326_14142 [Fusarium oxysporum f. sp. albedinis]|nr:Uncharacterized protein HZ326_14142 [Fusarium oxysporum f. sp. albedinis]